MRMKVCRYALGSLFGAIFLFLFSSIVGWYLGGIVGIGTVVFALGIGPFVAIGLFLVGRYIK